MGVSIQFQKIIDLKGHLSSIYGLYHGPESAHFYSTGGDGWLAKWDINSLNHDGLLIADTQSKLFSINGIHGRDLILTGDMVGMLYWIDVLNNNILDKTSFHKGSIFDIAIIDDNHCATVAGDGVLCIWDIEKRRPVYSRQLSAQGLRCLLLHNDSLYVGASDHNIYVLGTKDWEIQKTITAAHDNSVFTISNIDDTFLVTGGRDAHLKFWDIHTLEIKTDLPAHMYTINKIIPLTGTSLMATASRDKTIRIWDSNNFELIKSLDFLKGGHVNSVNDLIWLAKEKVLISCSDDRTIKTWKMLPG